jgi:hypothetical protein
MVMDWVKQLPHPVALVDFEETIQFASVQACTRLWRHNGELIAMAYVDDFSNLWFEIEPTVHLRELEDEIVEWGISVQKERHENTLDACVRENPHQMQILEAHGFVRSEVRTLKYSRDLLGELPAFPLPAGFAFRSVQGEHEVEALVALHRAAFGTGK